MVDEEINVDGNGFNGYNGDFGSYNDDDIVCAFINVVRRITNLEKEVAVIKTALRSSSVYRREVEAARGKWDDWARKIILKVVEWCIVIVSSVVGLRLLTGA